jgi:hypothetical protein
MTHFLWLNIHILSNKFPSSADVYIIIYIFQDAQLFGNSNWFCSSTST